MKNAQFATHAIAGNSFRRPKWQIGLEWWHRNSFKHLFRFLYDVYCVCHTSTVLVQKSGSQTRYKIPKLRLQHIWIMISNFCPAWTELDQNQLYCKNGTNIVQMIQGAPSALDRCKYLISRDTYSGFARRQSFIFCGIVFHWILVCGGHLYFAASSICCLGALSLSAPGKVPPIVGREQSPAAETETSVNCINQFSIIAYIVNCINQFSVIAYIVILYYCIYC